MNKVSIIVPIYKIEERYLIECLDSLISQTLKEIQIILIDDGSPDKCGVICDEYAKKDTRITVVHQANQGVSCARNKGITLVDAIYMLFLDGDDILAHDACEKLYNKMNECKTDILLYGHRCFDDFGGSNHLIGQDINFSADGIRNLQKVILNPVGDLLTIAPAGTVGKIYRSSFIIDNDLKYIPGLRRMQDNLFCLQAYQVAKSVYYYDYVGYFYRINPNSACNLYNPKIFQILENALIEFKYFIRNSAPELDKYYHCKVITVLENEYMRLYFRNKNNPKERKVLKAEFHSLLQNTQYVEAVNKVKISLLSPRLQIITLLLRGKQIELLWLILDIEDFLLNIMSKKRY